ncbi:MAG TPA: glycosyltransferase family 2 protein [Chitinophagaceae bacterium]|nr:glycosyltransferase family 2 protein [Chitinophagaceae bacterium]
MSCKDISIIVPSHKANSLLYNLLNAIARQQPAPGEFILVLDGITETVLLPEMPFPSKILVNDGRPGAAETRNKGAKEARGQYLFFLDADVLPEPELVGKTADMIEKDPAIDAWFGSYDHSPSQTNFYSQYKNLFNHYIHQHSSPDALTFWSACGLIKKNVFEKTGGFDNRYRMLEDIELGYRLKEKGYTLKLNKELQVKHQKKWTFLSLIHSDIFDRAIPWTRLLLRYHHMGSKDLNLQMHARFSFLLVVLLLISTGIVFIYPLIGLALAAGSVISLLVLNQKLYAFFSKKGVWFLVRAILMNWLYYLYSGVSFILAMTGYYLFRKKI